MDSYSKLTPCSGVTTSSFTSMSSSWCRVGLAVLICYFLHVQGCVVVGCSRLPGLCVLDMATLHFSLINLVEHASIGHFFVARSLQVMVAAIANLMIRCLLRLLILV